MPSRDTSWRERAEQRISAILKNVPGGRPALRNLRHDPFVAAEKHKDIIYKNIILSHCQGLLDMKGSREEQALRVVDYLIYSDVLSEPVDDVPKWRAGRYVHLRNLGYDKLQAVWAVAEQEGRGVTPETVLSSLRAHKQRLTKGNLMRGWGGEDFSDLPGLTGGKLRKPPSMPGIHPQEK